ncbi:WD40 repeat domain-containing protein [Candidatus Dependentiae bacterium]|nr:WD40 repeat domain-containing protein [Candidatus Dependentiae bacterium]
MKKLLLLSLTFMSGCLYSMQKDISIETHSAALITRPLMLINQNNEKFSSVLFNDQKTLFVVLDLECSTLTVYNALTYKKIGTKKPCPFSKSINRALTFNHEGDQFITRDGPSLNKPIIWYTEKNVSIETDPLKGHKDPIIHVAFSQKDDKFVTTSVDTTAIVWNASTNTELKVLKGHTSHVNFATFNQKGDTLITTADRETILWDATDYTQKASLPYTCGAYNGATDKILLLKDQYAHLWDAKYVEFTMTLRGHHEPIMSATFSPSGDKIITNSWNQAIIWDTATGQKITVINSPRILSAAFNAGADKIVLSSRDKTAKIYDSTTGTLLVTIQKQTDQDYIASALFNKEEDHLITVSSYGDIEIWDISHYCQSGNDFLDKDTDELGCSLQ